MFLFTRPKVVCPDIPLSRDRFQETRSAILYAAHVGDATTITDVILDFRDPEFSNKFSKWTYGASPPCISIIFHPQDVQDKPLTLWASQLMAITSYQVRNVGQVRFITDIKHFK